MYNISLYSVICEPMELLLKNTKYPYMESESERVFPEVMELSRAASKKLNSSANLHYESVNVAAL